MNVPADLMMTLARTLGVPTDLNAEGVVRCALERLKGEKEWHVEVFLENDAWTFHSFHRRVELAINTRAILDKRGANARVVELLRRPLL